MGRDRDGLDRADVDTGFLSDPKVGTLVRTLRDTIKTGAALTLYQAVLLASWDAGRRVPLDDCLPVWWLDDWEDLADALVKARLLDDERCIPDHAWDAWYVPAIARVQTWRDRAVKAGRASAAARQANPKSTQVEPGSNPSPTQVQPKPTPDQTSPVPDQRGLVRTTVRTSPARIDNGLDGLPHLTPDVQDEVQAATGLILSTASDRVLTSLDQLVERHGPERVSQTMGHLATTSQVRPTWPQYVYGTRNALDPIPGAPDSKTERERQDQAEMDRRRRRERTALDEPWRRQLLDMERKREQERKT